MGLRVGLLFLFVLVTTWACDARQLGVSDLSVLKINLEEEREMIRASKIVVQDDNLCTLCEAYATKALDYLAANKTQSDIIATLHMTCSRVPTFKKQCTTLVDYYASLFFSEISSIQPEDLCREVNFCEKMVMLASQLHEDSCEMCHRAVSEALIKLKDPDTQLEIIQILLKGCNSMQNYAKKCKKMVFEYGPLILANAEQYLETTDICTMLHACTSSTEASKVGNVSGLADA